MNTSGFGRDHDLQRAVFAQEIRRQNFDGGSRATRADGADGVGEMLRAAIGEIVAIDRGDDDVGQAQLGGRLADMRGFDASSRPGNPVFTLQKAQARVQVSPMIMKVACFLVHTRRYWGHPASSHTVCKPWARTIACVSR